MTRNRYCLNRRSRAAMRGKRSIDQGEQRMLTRLTTRTSRRLHFALVAGAVVTYRRVARRACSRISQRRSARSASGQQGGRAGGRRAGRRHRRGRGRLHRGARSSRQQFASAARQPGAKQASPAKGAKTAKGKAAQPAAAQAAEPQLTAEQIVANSDAYIERIKTELQLTPEQEKHWTGLQQRHALSRP